MVGSSAQIDLLLNGTKDSRGHSHLGAFIPVCTGFLLLFFAGFFATFSLNKNIAFACSIGVEDYQNHDADPDDTNQADKRKGADDYK